MPRDDDSLLTHCVTLTDDHSHASSFASKTLGVKPHAPRKQTAMLHFWPTPSEKEKLLVQVHESRHRVRSERWSSIATASISGNADALDRTIPRNSPRFLDGPPILSM